MSILKSFLLSSPWVLDRQRQMTRVVFATSFLLATSMMLLPTTSFADGRFIQKICVDPSTRKAVGAGGVPDGITKYGTTLWTISASCSGSNPTGIKFSDGYAINYAPGTYAAVGYRPGVLEFAGGVMYRSLRTRANTWLGINQHAGSDPSDVWGLPRNFGDQGDWFVGGMDRGSITDPFSSANRVNLIVNDLASNNGFTVTAKCIPNGPPDCPLAPSDSFVYQIYGGEIYLDDNSDPQVSGTPQGSLLTDALLKGTKEVTVNGIDQGSGIFAVRVLVDDNPAVTEVINSNNGRCVDLHPETPQVVETAYRQPCRLSTGGTVQVDTTKLPEGQHNVKIQMCDVGLNCATLANRPGTWIDNVPNVDDPPNPGGSGPGGGNGPGGGSGPGGSGMSLCAIDRSKCSNGTNASANATLVADWSRPSKRSKRERRLIKVVGDKAITTFDTRTVIRGQLINKDNGQPIEGAKVRLLQTPTRPGLFPEDVGGVRTRQNGRFTMIVPRGMTSRKLRFEYRPIEDDPFVAASRDLELAVKSSVVLKLSRRIIHPGTTLKFSGYVRGGHIPKNGKLLILKVRKNKRGRWVDFKTLRTKPNGRFSFNYRFVQGGRAFYQFVAASPFEEAFPFDTGKSRTRTASKR